MWRFIEEGPLLKFPLRESPFMAADPMYRDVVIAPPIRFQRLSTMQEHDSHSSFLSSSSERGNKSKMSLDGPSSTTVGFAMDESQNISQSIAKAPQPIPSNISSPSSGLYK